LVRREFSDNCHVINRSYGRWDNTNLDHIWDTLTPANDETLAYTDAARLLSASSTGTYGTRAWRYDGNGNRLSETANGTVNTYTYPASNNRLTNVKQGAVTTRAFTYDAAGNTTQDLRGATAYNYAVNNAGRIKTLTVGTTLKATWTYDGFQKLRVKVTTSPVATTHYIWDSFGHIIEEVTGSFVREYIWLGDTPLAANEGTTLSYVHPDHLDRPIAMTTSGGPAIAWSAKYDPFGNVVTTTNATAMPLRFPGQLFQIEDGLSYNWHRSYDPTLGRYSQADPLGFVDGPGIYNYAGQSPLMMVDRDGRCPLCVAAVVGAAIGVGLEYWFHGDCATLGDYAGAALMGAALGVGGELLGPVIGAGGRLLGIGGRGAGAAAGEGLGVGASTGLGLARQLGAAGESLAGLSGPKVAIRILGSNRLRIPDNLTPTTLTEVKNVASQSLTKQIKDFAAYARQNGLKFELILRQNTVLTSPLRQAEINGEVKIINSLPPR
jgi:RHS repeat-associated protein